MRRRWDLMENRANLGAQIVFHDFISHYENAQVPVMFSLRTLLLLTLSHSLEPYVQIGFRAYRLVKTKVMLVYQEYTLQVYTFVHLFLYANHSTIFPLL